MQISKKEHFEKFDLKKCDECSGAIFHQNLKKSKYRLFQSALIFVIFLINILFSLSINFAYGPGEISPTSKKIAVVGDSYAGYFITDEGLDKFEPFIFPVGTISEKTNIDIFEQAINADNNYIFFCTGTNDQALGTSTKTFENVLREHVKKIEEKNKYLFLHTYMDYPKKIKSKISPKKYDDILKKISQESDRVFYIDMSGMDKKSYNRGDGIHYSKFFNDTLKTKLLYLTGNLDRYLSSEKNDKITPSNNRQIAVTGDEYANLFYLLENNKGYELLDFTNKDKNALENVNLMLEAFNSTAKYVVISIGAKDYIDQIDLVTFENILRILANRSLETNKAVFMHTYMDYKPKAILKNHIEAYDAIIKKVANEYDNICYVDMHLFEDKKYVIKNSNIFDMNFYDSLYNLISNMINLANTVSAT